MSETCTEKAESEQRQSASEMDEERQKTIAYQYLCHLEEAKKWIETCIEEALPPTAEMEEEFRHGVYLVKLACLFAPDIVATKKVFDSDLAKYTTYGLQFRHTDNISYFLRALKGIGLPRVFFPETYDIYNKRNIPKLVFCLHALSMYLFRLGITPQMQNLYGKVYFSDAMLRAMMRELCKQGNQLPQFGKIGGILASELPGDEFSLHEAIIQINNALIEKDIKKLTEALTNPVCQLSDVLLESIEIYYSVLCEVLERKIAVAELNKNHDDCYVSDIYEKILTQAEIEGHIKQSNVNCALGIVEAAVEISDKELLLKGLYHRGLAPMKMKEEFVGEYLLRLDDVREERRGNQSMNQSITADHILSKSCIHRVVKEVNHRIEQRAKDDKVLKKLNEVWLRDDTYHESYKLLRVLKHNFKELMPYAAPLYHNELSIMRKTSRSIALEELIGGIAFLTAIGYVNAAVETRNPDEIWKCLKNPTAGILDLNENLDYSDYLIDQFEKMQDSERTCRLMSYQHIQDIIDEVNENNELDQEKIMIVGAVNKAVLSKDADALVAALCHKVLGVTGATLSNGCQFLRLLENVKASKSVRLGEEDPEIWVDDVYKVVERIQEQEKEALRIMNILCELNLGIRFRNLKKTVDAISMYDIGNRFVQEELKLQFAQKMIEKFNPRMLSRGHPWVIHTIDNSEVFFNIDERSFHWRLPAGSDIVDVMQGGKYAGVEDLLEVVGTVFQHINEQAIIKFQALWRGYLVRKQLGLMHRYATIIQVWWRKVRAKRAASLSSICSIVSSSTAHTAGTASTGELCDGKLALQRSSNPRSETQHIWSQEKWEEKAIIIQRAWRKHKARMDLHALTHCDNPSLPVVRKFVDLLQVSPSDFKEELRLQKINKEVAQALKYIQKTEANIDQMDIKIGLLVQNRIKLEDVIRPVNDKENENPNEKVAKKNKKNKKDATLTPKKGLKTLKKDCREKLVCYQHLFYHLQTHPHYLAQLINGIPAGNPTRYLEEVLFNLFNYGSSDRDNYLLLKLLKLALEEEIKNKVMRLSDMNTTNSLIIKIIVSLNRKGIGQNSLKEMLGPLVHKVMDEKNLFLITNPVEVFKIWVTQLEMATGKPSGLPYHVTVEQAMKYPEVRARIGQGMRALTEWAKLFCNHITSCTHMIPYTMKYMAKVMKQALHKRFPHVQDREILKSIGHLLYYRYINSAIVAPDAFDIISITYETKLTSEQRKNLASISKVLQAAVSNKGFDDDIYWLKGLNELMAQCHEKFTRFFEECCMVEEPFDVYNYNQFSEATMIFKPTISLTQQEIMMMHELLITNEGMIAPDASDPLHELLQDLGEGPGQSKILTDSEDSELTSDGPLARVEICLSLSNKFALQEEDSGTQKPDKDSNERLINRTKQLVVDIVQCVEGERLASLTNGPTRPEQERKFQAIRRTREEHETKAKLNETDLNTTNEFLGDINRSSLSEAKTKLKHNLRRLETRGLTSSCDGYQTILNSVALDIVQQRNHRIARRNQMQKVGTTFRKLMEKQYFLEDQLNSYRTYLNSCLNSMSSRNKNVHQRMLADKSNKKLKVQYTATKLYEKGVIVKIDNLPLHQFKNVLVEFYPRITAGVFNVQVNFLGVPMEIVPIDIQELLQLQYEGISLKRMCDRVTVNVNLLIHLLNEKYYKKK